MQSWSFWPLFLNGPMFIDLFWLQWVWHTHFQIFYCPDDYTVTRDGLPWWCTDELINQVDKSLPAADVILTIACCRSNTGPQCRSRLIDQITVCRHCQVVCRSFPLRQIHSAPTPLAVELTSMLPLVVSAESWCCCCHCCSPNHATTDDADDRCQWW